MSILTDLNKEGKTIIVVTHDKGVAALCSKTVHIIDGYIKDEVLADKCNKNIFQD